MSIARALTIALLALTLELGAHGQCLEKDENAPPSLTADALLSAQGDEQLLPESGYLSNHVYTSVFFGFELELPLEVEGHRMMLPLMPSGQHALLALAFENGGRRGSIIIVASEPANAQYKMTEAQKQEEQRRWAQNQPALHREMPDWMMRSGHMYHTEKRTGDQLISQFTTRIKNYTIRLKIESNDQDFSKKAKRLIEAVQFYCPEADGTLTTPKGDTVIPQGAPYHGPTIPTWRVDARLAEKPEEHALPLGSVVEGVYRNPELGLSFVLPDGWQVKTTSTDASVSSTPDGAEKAKLRIHEYLDACSATLVHATHEETTAVAPKHEHQEIILRALDPACLSLRGPDTIRDQQGADELAAYLEMFGAFGHIQSTDLVSVSGRVFTVFRGAIGEDNPNNQIPTRASQMIFVTRYNKLLFLWSLIVPRGSELQRQPQTKVTFGGESPVEIGPALVEKK